MIIFLKKYFLVPQKGISNLIVWIFEKESIKDKNIKQFLDYLKREKFINLIVFNKNKLDIFLEPKYFDKIFSSIGDMNKIFFANPDTISDALKSFLFILNSDTLKKISGKGRRTYRRRQRIFIKSKRIL